MQESDEHQVLELESSFTTPKTHASKKRKMVERVVVVKVEEHEKKQQRNEGPPSDCWSWRKYGQKPIKGSPYPRGYYRCSTSKGCSAKKQVERSKTDASMLIITYTSTHNHPGPNFPLSPPTKLKPEEDEEREDTSLAHDHTHDDHTHPTTPKQEEQEEEMPQETPATDSEYLLQYPTSDHTIVNQEETQPPFQESNAEKANVVAYSEDPKPFSDDPVELSPLLKAGENDFYDELEELPTSSFFTAFMKSNSCEERIAVNLS